MELVFLRHGKAELRSDAKADYERELTPMGRKKIKQAAQGLAKALYANRNILIWSSPTKRTLQTAEILKAAFGKKASLQIMDSIMDGDYSDLRTAWTQAAPIDVLFIVGHEPALSDWTQKICGAALAFRPGSAASITLNDPEHTIGSLSWFMRVGVMGRLIPPPTTQRRQRS